MRGSAIPPPKESHVPRALPISAFPASLLPPTGILSNKTHLRREPQDSSKDLENSRQLGTDVAEKSPGPAGAVEPFPWC